MQIEETLTKATNGLLFYTYSNLQKACPIEVIPVACFLACRNLHDSTMSWGIPGFDKNIEPGMTARD
ncbi:MAG: hypothetical protein H6696_18195 [Deferribacteres bacterium]|nr:hypothetical protein [Deferribacteres bacterium]